MDIVSIYNAAGITLTPMGDRYTSPCPFHREVKPSFVVYPDGGFHCFGCGAHGNPGDISNIFGLAITHVKDLETVRDPLEGYLHKMREKFETELEFYVMDQPPKKMFRAYDQFDAAMIDAEELMRDMEATPLRLLSFLRSQFKKITCEC